MRKQFFLLLTLFTYTSFSFSVSITDWCSFLKWCFGTQQQSYNVRSSRRPQQISPITETLIEDERWNNAVEEDGLNELQPLIDANSSEQRMVSYGVQPLQEDDYLIKRPDIDVRKLRHVSVVDLIENKGVSPNRYIKIKDEEDVVTYQHILCCVTSQTTQKYLIDKGAMLNGPSVVVFKGKSACPSNGPTCLDALKIKATPEVKEDLTRQAQLQAMRLKY